MARSKYKATTSGICADCGALEPAWASINRAILLCDQCCSIHRSLGCHISQIKSLHKSLWNTNLLSMVHALNDNGANSIWEHSLLDPSNLKIHRKKPQPKDPLHPVKSDFIKAKHQQLAFILRPNKDEFSSDEELSKQLHSSVRTSNLETSLRLLAQGANPNYFHKEKGTTPLHVAVRASQPLQLELLIANGANPNAVDSSGQIPADIAKAAGNLELAQRLVECMYQLTDRLSFYICSRKPNHRKSEHLIIPETPEIQQLLKESKTNNSLQTLPNYLLEELAMDVYDEVDRRETESIWLSSANMPERSTVPFLPVNPCLSSTRNQGRQKLATFTANEFTTLIVHLLTEARRRHMLFNNNATILQDPAVSALRNEHFAAKHKSQLSDDEPLYDSVASDDDYAALTTTDKSIVQLLQKQLNLSETIIQNLHKDIQDLQQTVTQLTNENSNTKIPLANDLIINGSHNGNHEQEPVLESGIDAKSASSRNVNQRPASMYETREGLKKSASWTLTIGQSKSNIDDSNSNTNVKNLWNYQNQNLPSSDQVTRRTEQVTKRIQELWMAMQDPTHRETFVPCAERIRVAVAELTAIFPHNPIEDNIRAALRQLNGNTGRLQAECAALQRSINNTDHTERCLQQVRSCAYDIAKATKLLVTHFQISSPTSS
ncbi:hypothetical protein PV326_007594 [Microctonus aethiopoides]|nr:hypothetical protein PV326_007594 [Microctonus aethiopoides]